VVYIYINNIFFFYLSIPINMMNIIAQLQLIMALHCNVKIQMATCIFYLKDFSTIFYLFLYCKSISEAKIYCAYILIQISKHMFYKRDLQRAWTAAHLPVPSRSRLYIAHLPLIIIFILTYILVPNY
jgi:hypothetical protein